LKNNNKLLNLEREYKMQPWLIWMIAAILLFILEIFTPGFLLACLGIGCLAGGGFALMGLGLSLQVIIFAVISQIVFFGIRPFILKRFYTASEGIKTNVDALVGKQGVVTEAINPAGNIGRIVVGGEDWRGVTEDNSAVDAGVSVKVIRVEGTKLIVEPIYSNKED